MDVNNIDTDTLKQENNQPNIEPNNVPPQVTIPIGQQQPITPDFSKLEPIQQPKPKKKMKIFVIVLASIFFFVMLIIALVFFYLNSQFPAINYDNGQGDSFTLRYYDDHKLEKDYSKIDALNNSFTSGNADTLDGPAFLISPEVDGLSLAMSIVKSEDQSFSVTESESLCENRPFSVSHYDEIRPVCGAFLSVNGKPMFYFYEFTVKETKYLVTIFENFDKDKFLVDEASAAELVEKLDLNKYNDDLDIILGSIEVKQ